MQHKFIFFFCILDILCASNTFLGIGWVWSLYFPPINVYCQVLRDHKWMHHYTKICDQFFAPLYELRFCRQCPRLSDETIQVLQYCYLDEKTTYLIIYRATKDPHTMPTYVPNIFIIWEIAYQTTLHGLNPYLFQQQNSFPCRIFYYKSWQE